MKMHAKRPHGMLPRLEGEPKTADEVRQRAQRVADLRRIMWGDKPVPEITPPGSPRKPEKKPSEQVYRRRVFWDLPSC